MAKRPALKLKLSRWWFALILPGMITGNAFAEQTTYQPVEDISQLVHQQLMNHYQASGRFAEIQINTKTPDPRLRLARCDQPLFIEAANTLNSGRITTQVACNGRSSQWSVYVGSEVTLMTEVVVARTPLFKGQVISAEDLDIALAPVTHLNNGYMPDIADILGRELKRSVKTGDQLRAQWLVAPRAIKRGERVVIVASSNQVAVETAGTALSDGRLGEQIRVKNDRSKRIISATVEAEGLVSVRL